MPFRLVIWIDWLYQRKTFFFEKADNKKNLKKMGCYLNIAISIAIIHILMVAYCAGFATYSWMECYPTDSYGDMTKYLPEIYSFSNVFPIMITLYVASNLDTYHNYYRNPYIESNRDTHYERDRWSAFFWLGIQSGMMAFYVFCTTLVCKESESALSLWILLGIIQAIYVLFSLGYVCVHF